MNDDGHREIPVKVNALVDEGVAPLVEALSEIDDLITIESCQGDRGQQDAYVIFRMHDWRAVGEFLFGRLLPVLPPDIRAVTALRVQAYDADLAHGSIVIDPCAIDAVSRCVAALKSRSEGPCPFVTRNAHSDAVAKAV
jgi:hypothetical protein